MSQYRLKIKAGTGRQTVVEETYTIPRADAEVYLQQLAAKPQLEAGEVHLQAILLHHLKDPGTKKFRITLKRS